MKTRVLILVLLPVLFCFFSCDEEDKDIVYPKTGNFGENLLQHDSVAIVASSDLRGVITSYSMRAELPENTSVKLVMSYHDTQNGSMEIDHHTRQGWSLNYVYYSPEERSSIYHFYASGQEVCELEVFFYYSGTAEIEIYENGDTIPVRIKKFSWKP